MKSFSEIEIELRKLGVRNQFWCKPEIKELVHVLTDEETITNAANGRYQGGFALIVITNHRLLLIDKKLWSMTMEDVRFDMITEVDYTSRLFDATISVRTINKVLRFTSIHQKQLRGLTKYLQGRILELRQMMMQQAGSSQAQTQPAAQMPVQFTMVPQPPVLAVSQPQETNQPEPAQQLYTAQIKYTRPNRLRRMGAIPAASFTMQHQRYLTVKR